VSEGKSVKTKRIAGNWMFTGRAGQVSGLLNLVKLGGILLSLVPVTGW
jgi:hypothetical protein